MTGTKSSKLVSLERHPLLKKTIRLTPEGVGKIGEAWAAEWLKDHNCDFVPLETLIGDKPECLTKIGGKRPDFIAYVDDCVMLLDAKLNKTENCTWFTMSDKEIDEYKNGEVWLRNILAKQQEKMSVETWFMLFPSESKGTRIVFVPLTDLISGTPTTMSADQPAHRVAITGRQETWFHHVPKAPWPNEDGL